MRKSSEQTNKLLFNYSALVIETLLKIDV